MNSALKVGVLGATSHVGRGVLPLLVEQGFQVFAFSRQLSCDSEKRAPSSVSKEQRELLGICSADSVEGSVSWLPVSAIERLCRQQSITYWICLAPIWVVSDYFKVLHANHAKRIVVLSSTSRFSKQSSPEPVEQALATRLEDSEAGIKTWAEGCGIEFVILRPTLIYGLGRDRNICEIIRLIRRFGFFPLLGQAKGLRQPVHCIDVAQACISALHASDAKNKCYNLSGLETLSYRDMVARIFEAVNRSPRCFHVPLSILRVILGVLRLLPRYRYWKSSMLERMNQDLVFDHQEAARDLGFKPRPFRLTTKDLP